jgi:hypothetical protein
MPHVYRSSVEAILVPKESSVVRPRTPSSTPPEPHRGPHFPIGEPAHTEVDMPHVDADAYTVSGPLSETHPSVTMIPPHHHPHQSSRPPVSSYKAEHEEGAMRPLRSVHYL